MGQTSTGTDQLCIVYPQARGTQKKVTNMKVHKITLHEAAVKAILDGRKTQTRIPLSKDTVDLPNPDATVFWYDGNRAPDVCWFEGMTMNIVRIRPSIRAGDTLNIFTRDSPVLSDTLLVKVKHLWLQQLQDITSLDAIKEGIQVRDLDKDPGDQERLAFRVWWDAYYEGSNFEWSKNPWVWVCEIEEPK